MLENRIANSVVEHTNANNGYFILASFGDKKFIHFAADNVDFQEDIPDGKRTLHASVMSIYH